MSIWEPQPNCVYDVAGYFLRATGRSTIVDIGCGTGNQLLQVDAARRIGIDHAENIEKCRQEHKGKAEWYELGAARQQCVVLPDSDSVVVCTITQRTDLADLFTLLSICWTRGALILTSAPDGTTFSLPSQTGPSFPDTGWSLQKYRDVLDAVNLPPIYVGRAPNRGADQSLSRIISLHDPLVQQAKAQLTEGGRRPLAVLSTYNESDVIAEVMQDLVEQGCDLAVIDNWSTDGTWEIIEHVRRSLPDRVESERFPSSGSAENYEWQKILYRKEEIAATCPGRWIIHTDADELRRSPFPGTTLAQGLEIASITGASRVNFNLINFRPVDDRPFSPGSLSTSFTHFEFGTRPGHFAQGKAWFQGDEKVSLAASGGHMVKFTGARDFPYRFLLRHYPIRSKDHGARKVFVDRRSRWSPYEKNTLGWHNHYDGFSEESDFTWPKTELIPFNEDFWENHGIHIITDLLQKTV
ncbi:glycosyltransferase [Nitratireductor luteus]|uniref:glycosyltransferase n=1 Tax=Nitratireductor luteus TaxID=2976980 RepID=UPI0022409D3E